jgi:uncharacterized protein YjdB
MFYGGEMMKLKGKFKMVSLLIIAVMLLTNFAWKTDTVTAATSTTTAYSVSEVPELLITEIMPLSQNIDDAYEYIELYNSSNNNIDLKDYKCIYPNFDFNASKIIPSKGVLVVCTRNTTTIQNFNAFYGTNLTQDQYLTLPFTSEILSNDSLQNIILAKDDNKLTVIAKYEKEDFAINKSVTYKYSQSGFYMQTLGKLQSPTPGSVTADQIPFDMTIVTGIVIDKTLVNLEINQIIAIGATVSPTTAANKAIKWSSDNLNIAKVNEYGVVTAISNGVATVTAKTEDGGFTATCLVVVGRIPVTGITLDKISAILEVGKAITLVDNITPLNATNKSVTWASSNGNVAVVDKNGTIVGISQGISVITAKSEDGNFIAACTLVVTNKVDNNIPVSGVDLNKTLIQTTEGKNEKLIPTVLPVNATNKLVTWVSDNPLVAAVDKDGNIAGHLSGLATITVKTVDGNYTNKCVVIVDKNNTQIITSIRMNKKAIIIKKGKAERLIAITAPGKVKFKAVNWKSSNPSIATVDAYGWVTAINSGNAIITAIITGDSNYSANCSVSVIDKKGNNKEDDNGKGNGNKGNKGNNKGKGHNK